MWEARSGDTRIVMLGSVHQLPPELDWQDARVAAAIGSADQLWLELSPEELPAVSGLFSASATDEVVPTLDQRLGASLGDRLRDIVAASGVDEDDADRLESWGLAMIAGVQLAKDAGLTAENGVESRLTDAFRRAGRPIHGLEHSTVQLRAFDRLPDAAQDRMLRFTVEEAGEARAQFQQLLAAWARGDAAQMGRLAQEDLARIPGMAEFVVTQRNRNWVAQINGWRGRGSQILVAVGTGHLVGSEGLPQLLANAGWQVRALP